MSKYLAMALDPIHIGTGGYYVGRVDNVIVREPATNLPKIPGSSIAGTARTYTTYKKLEENDGANPDISINCAGQDKEASEQGEKGHCGKCIVCKSFGYSKKDEKMGSRQGLVHFSDAQILLFPVSTRLGPAWATSPMIMEDFGVSLSANNKPSEKEIIVASKFATESSLNLGWLNLPIKNDGEVPRFDKLDNLGSNKEELITERIIVVPDNLVLTC